MRTKSLKTRLISAVLVLVMMIGSLVGTTFAWFTDSVSSAGNKIVSGSLKVDLELLDKESGEWASLKESKDPIFNYTNWEPGYVDAKILKVENEGSLALKWKAMFVSENELSVLADVIDVYVKDYGVLADDSTVEYPADRTLEGYTKVGTLKEFVNTIEHTTYGNLLAGQAAYLGIALKMQESADNNYQDKAIGAFDIQIVATQMASENDSFGNDYDSLAEWPVLAPGQSFTATAPVTPNAEGKVDADTTVGDPSGDIYANVPAGVKMAAGASALQLTVEALTQTGSNVSATHRSEVVRSVDVHIDGVATDNDVPMVITLNAILPTGLNSNNVKLYHVENGVTVEMTLVADPTNHNEFSYDPLNGNVMISIASFSEIVVYGDTAVDWNGTVASGFAGGTGTESDPYTIANGEQLAYFRNAVDNGTTFEGKFVKLTASINLNDINFDPIGFGYDYDGFMTDGKTFNGTFDGGNHTIYGLYQNGWEANDCGNKYDYSMAGGGLFASVVDATIKNLTISGADIVMECIDMGVVCGYAQGNCTFDNIAIVNCTIQNYNRYTGGVVGECSPRYDANGTPLHSNHVFNNIRVDSTTTVSSLWGSFDTSLGGILGGKWDKYGDTTKVTMTNCDVACKIDAFNDVTSAYQWYAYRRAGMLIGNTEQSASNKALADFLTCKNVRVYYGEWNNYHYCEFENQSDAEGNSSSWNRYPWVRVESGLSCSAYSNPRYGHPIVNGTAIVDSIHSHEGDDQCMISLPFKQLYGGGQGVYGATEHINADGTNGVNEGAYTVTYMDENKLLRVEFVASNSSAHTVWAASNYKVGAESPENWVDASGNKIPSVDAGNTKHIVLYPKWKNEYAIRFLDAADNVLYYETFERNKSHDLDMDAINATLAALQQKVDASKKIIEISWNTDLSSINFKNAKADILVKAVYTIKDTVITLVEVKDASGNIVGYAVTETKETDLEIDIPSHVGIYPVIQVKENAFAGFDNLHVVTLPTTITYLGSNALAADWENGTFESDKGESMTIYYEGSYQQWLDTMTFGAGWSDGVSASTRIFFLNGTDTVDFSQGYLQFVVDDKNWLGAVKEGHFEHVNTVPESFVDEHYTNCDCKVDGCSGNLRPDAKYWAAHVN